MSFLCFAKSAAVALWRDRNLTARSLALLQKKKLSRIVSHAKRRVPFHRRRLSDISLHRFDLQDLPPVESSEMNHSFADTVVDGLVTSEDIAQVREAGNGCVVRDRFLVSETTGTTGKACLFLNDFRSWDTLRGAVFARTFRDQLPRLRAKRFSRGRTYRMAFVVTTAPTAVSAQAAEAALKRNGRFVEARLISVTDPVDAIVAELNDFQPDYLHSYPTMLEVLAHERLAGHARFTPRFVSTSSEALTTGARSVLAEAFPDVAIAEQYGATECIALANDCSHGRMHLNADYSIVEPVDEHDQPVPVGTPSHHILLTNLVNTVQPIIRYRVTDSICLTGEDCPCGRALPVIQIQGRTDDIFWLHDRCGNYQPHSPPALKTQMYSPFGIASWRLIHRCQNELEIQFVLSPLASSAEDVAASIRKTFAEYLAQSGLESTVKVQPIHVQAIERSGTNHKLRQIESLVAPPPEVMRRAA